MNIESIRKDFPLLTKPINGKKVCYFDNAATSLKPQSVIDAISDYYLHYSANPGRGEYDSAFQTYKKVEEARENIAKFLNAETEEVVFTSGTTMSINLIAQGYGLHQLTENDEILITEADHSANTLPWYHVAKITRAKLIIIPLEKEQRLTETILLKYINKKTKVLAFPEISNVYGIRNDVKALTAIAHTFNTVVVVDGAQAAPHLTVDLKDTQADFYVFSGHKMCGPTGIGIMVGNRKLLEKMEGPFFGGGMNIGYDKSMTITYAPIPQKFEAGTLHVAGVFGLNAAIHYLNNIGLKNIHQHEMALRAYAIKGLKALSNVVIYNEEADSAIITFNIKGVFSQDAATFLNTKGIALRSGQHCSRNIDPLLKEHGTLRWSAYFYNTFEEVDLFIDAVSKGGDYLDAYFE